LTALSRLLRLFHGFILNTGVILAANLLNQAHHKAADSSSKAAESSSKGSHNVANAAHGEGVGGAGGGGGGREEAVTQLPTPTKHREGRPMKALFKALLRRL
jgi:hypothetical protein